MRNFGLRLLWGPALVAIIALAGCGPQQNVRSGAGGEKVPDPAQHAVDLLKAGQPEAAAQAFLKLSVNSPASTAAMYRLRAANAYIDARKIPDAKQVLAATHLDKSSVDQQVESLIVTSRIDAGEGHPDVGLVDLQQASRLDTIGSHAARIHGLNAEYLDSLNRPLDAAAERAELGTLLTDPAAKQSNGKAIWAALSNQSVAALNQRLPSASPALRPWLELALVHATTRLDPNQFKARVEQWKQAHPGHIGADIMTAELAAHPEQTEIKPNQVALLLPLSGQFAGPGAAIRDGFITAWYADNSNGQRPTIQIYNTSHTDIAKVYDQAVTDGAQLVVGPLEKSAVEALSKREHLPVPTLALNDVLTPLSTTRVDNLFQFGLPPEEEARQVAQRAWFDGHAHALAMVPDDPWGQRVLQAFKDRWQTLGGELVESQTYQPDTQDYSTPVKQLLDIDASEARIKAISRVVGRRVVSEPQRRQDVDFIFLAAFPNQARQICPQLRFHRADDLPVYSTSHIYVGTPNATRDSDIDGTVFGDMPWILKPDNGDPAKAVIEKKWPDDAVVYGRLYAFGVDAYRLIPHLANLTNQPGSRFDGETGILSEASNGEIQRQLTWAKFSNGLPILLDQPTAPNPPTEPAQAAPTVPPAQVTQPAQPTQPEQ